MSASGRTLWVRSAKAACGRLLERREHRGALLLLRPETLRGAALLRPMVPLIPERLPELTSISVLVVAGNQDPIVSVENARELAALLRRAGADVTVCFENAGHALINTTVETTKRWLVETTK